MDRRTFIQLLLAAAIPPVAAAQRHRNSALVLVAVYPRADAPGVRGVRLGAEEAERTATLLGTTLQFRVATDTGTTGADIVIWGRPDPPPAGRALTLVTAEATEPARRSGPLYIRPGDQALARARARVKAAPVTIVTWDPSLAKFGASELNERFARRYGTPMDEAEWVGWVAAKIGVEIWLRRTPGQALGDAARTLAFDGHKGAPLTFDVTGELRQPLYARDEATGRVTELPLEQTGTTSGPQRHRATESPSGRR